MEFTTYTLPNGIRGIHRRIKGNVTHCALLVNAGSRDELKNQFGLAHFTEHALFKGTEHRKAYQVNCRLENLGGELNAFTTKEDTTIHATTLRSDFSKAVELIADVAFHSTFPDRELEKEKEIIYDEINTYKDSPADMIYDTFEEMLFAGSELGHNILGRKSSLARFSGESIREFVARTHTTDQMVFSSIGNLSAKSVETTVARYLNDIKSSARDFSRRQPAAVEPFSRIVTKHTHQTHCIIGARAQGINDAERLPLALLVNLLGGPSANSLLNVLVREKNGLSYNIEGLLHALQRQRHRGHLFQLRPRQHGSLHRADRGRAGTAPNHAALGPTAFDGQEAVHRPAGDLDGEQRRLHARCGQEFPGAPRGRYDGGGLSQNTGSHGRRPDRRSFVGLLLTIAAHL